ncbi:MAG: response regulator [Deltaproteobacteria bacterium]|nr:response regulator [Deltaproteobacteria bacterium]
MGKTILIVDNDRAVRSMASFTLSLESCVVFEAFDVSEALKRLQEGVRPELIIAGADIAGADFCEFIMNIRSLPQCRFTPVIVLADERLSGREMEWREAGAVCWIFKPFAAEQLLDVVGLLNS